MRSRFAIGLVATTALVLSACSDADTADATGTKAEHAAGNASGLRRLLQGCEGALEAGHEEVSTRTEWSGPAWRHSEGGGS